MKTFLILAVVAIGVTVGIYTKGDLGPVLSGLWDWTVDFSPVKTVRMANPLG